MFVSVLLFGLAGVLTGTERHSYDGGAVAPDNVTVTQGHTYQISIPGGVETMSERNVNPAGLQCQWSSPTAGSQSLDITPEKAESKATNTIATFVSPVSGSIHVDCTSWGTVFVDDAENASPDFAGLFLVLGMFVFVLGLVLLVSPKMSRRPAPSGGQIWQSAHAARISGTG